MTRALLLLAAWLATIATAPFNPQSAARIDELPGAPIPLGDPVVDEHGATTTLAQIAYGRPLLLVPVLHDCPNLCEVTLDGLARALAGTNLVPDRDVAVVAFGIDPRESVRDAASSLDRLAARRPALAGRVHATVASAQVVAHVTGALGYHFGFDPRAGQFAHAAAVAVVTPDRHLSRWLYGLGPEPAALNSAVADARRGTSTSWTEQLLLLCYHYDPATGRYGLAIDWLLRGFGLLTIAGLSLFILFSRRREGRA